MAGFRVPLPVRWFFYKRIWRINQPGTVFLTFDDGPSGSLTEWILDLLSKESIPATFFCVGENVQRFPMLAERMRQEGHVVANHSMKHEKGIKTSRAAYVRSVEQADKLIESNLFRPPYGRVNMIQTRAIRKKYQIIMWSWLSKDYDASVPVHTIIEDAAKSIQQGDILLLHDNHKVEQRLKEILPELIRIVREKNLSFGLISV